MEERVFACFKDVIGVEDTADRATIVYNEHPGWDSVAHMTLVAAIETEFDCMMDMDDILDMSSFDKAVEIVGKYA